MTEDTVQWKSNGVEMYLTSPCGKYRLAIVVENGKPDGSYYLYGCGIGFCESLSDIANVIDWRDLAMRISDSHEK